MNAPFLIDINCDVGEGVGNEAQLFPHISSCSIACGGHAGDANSIRTIARLAHGHNVKIGAHPSYPDKENFGREAMVLPKETLKMALSEQMTLFFEIAIAEKIPVNHIKPHGALYNSIAKDIGLAETFLEAVLPYREKVALYVPPASQIAKIANENDFQLRYEAFGDRRYNEDLSLVSRKLPDAVIEDPKTVVEQLTSIVEKGLVRTITGKMVGLKADTFCIHGDTPTALEILMYLTNNLPQRGIYLSK